MNIENNIIIVGIRVLRQLWNEFGYPHVTHFYMRKYPWNLRLKSSSKSLTDSINDNTYLKLHSPSFYIFGNIRTSSHFLFLFFNKKLWFIQCHVSLKMYALYDDCLCSYFIISWYQWKSRFLSHFIYVMHFFVFV